MIKNVFSKYYTVSLKIKDDNNVIDIFFFFFFFDAPIKNKKEIYEKILKRKIIMTLLHEMY